MGNKSNIFQKMTFLSYSWVGLVLDQYEGGESDGEVKNGLTLIFRSDTWPWSGIMAPESAFLRYYCIFSQLRLDKLTLTYLIRILWCSIIQLCCYKEYFSSEAAPNKHLWLRMSIFASKLAFWPFYKVFKVLYLPKGTYFYVLCNFLRWGHKIQFLSTALYGHRVL